MNFKSLLQEIKQREAERADRHLILHRGQGDLVERHLSSSSLFCRSLVSCGYLSQEQMQRAVQRYRIGMSRDGGVIFWQIGRYGQVYDGKIMYYRSDCHRDHGHHPTWVSAVLKRFYLAPDDPLNDLIHPIHALFGLHLLTLGKVSDGESGNHNSQFSARALLACYQRDARILDSQFPPVAVVESEKTAIICSEHFPEYLWMATGGLSELSPDKLFPLRGRRIILFPDTDPDGTAYRTWYEVARKAQWLLGHPVTVSPLLEQRASPAQKAAKIDLADFLLPNL